MSHRIPGGLKFLIACLIVTLSVLGVARAYDAPHAVPQVAIVGCAHVHLPGFIQILKKRTADVKVKCVWDHDAARAHKRADELGATVEPDLAKIWADPQIAAVIICSETDRHQELVVAAAKARKHIYAEKPLGMGAADSQAMAKAIEDAGVIFETGYFMRGDPKILFIKDEIAKGTFGKITRVRGSNCHGGALGGWFDTEWRWMADPKIAGIGGYGDLGTHSLDIMLWLMGNDVERVTAAVSNGTARYPDCDELGEGLLVFKSGTIGSLAAGWDDISNPVTLEVCGTEGHAAIVNDKLFFQSKKVEGADGKTPWTKLPAALPKPMELFIDAINGKANVPLVSVRDAAYRAAVTEVLYQAAREQKWVTVSAAASR